MRMSEKELELLRAMCRHYRLSYSDLLVSYLVQDLKHIKEEQKKEAN